VAGETIIEIPLVSTRLEASGSVADFDASRLAIIIDTFASSVQVTSDKVTVDVLAGSVFLDVAIQFSSRDLATAAQASLADSMGSAAAASTFLSAAGVQVVNTPTFATSVTLVVTAPPPSPSSPAESTTVIQPTSSSQTVGTGIEADSSTETVAIVIIAIVAVCVVLVVIFMCCRLSKTPIEAPKSTKAMAASIGVVSSTTTASSRQVEEVSLEIGSPKQPVSPEPGSPVPGSPSTTPRRSASPVPAHVDTPGVIEKAIAKLDQEYV
jgi:hypothetical protein